ncbi:glycosyltransferase [candidate division KSB1 bacterium]|nr:glycosyltransferase [candidate division KSB1 bacterium]
MNNKTVSIIIPAYNEEKCLPLCLDSINNLNYPKKQIEVIVVDNGSTDRTRDIARSYDGVIVLRDDTMNVSGLRNLGANHAKGDILVFVDADCIVSKDWLKNAEIYFGDTEVPAWGAPPIPPKKATWVQQTWYLVRQKKEMVQNVGWLESMNLFVRKKQFLTIGGFNETLITCEDVDFGYRIFEFGKIISDSRIEVTHLGEARTVREFMKKEIWRGRSNLAGILSHGLTLQELPSLSIPVYFGIFLPLFFVAFGISLNSKWLFAGLLFYLLPSVAVLFKVRRGKIVSVASLRLLFLIQVYFYSRTVAVLKKS